MRYKKLTILPLCLSAIISTGAKDNGYLDKKLPEKWSYESPFTQTIPTEDNWWKCLDDNLLDSLIYEGVQNNYNLMMAARRITIARQNLNNARSQYLPYFDLNASWNKVRSSGMNGTQPSAVDYFSMGINMSWQIDLFGKITSQAREKKALWQASQAQYAGAMITLCSEIAKTYAQLRTWQAEWVVAQEHITSQHKIVKLTEARHEAGIASMLDVTQARLVYYSTCASVPSLETSISSAISSLAILIGVYPDSLTSELSAVKPLPEYRHIVATGIPMELLRRRPDIAESEFQIASYAAAIGVAKKEFLPALALNGSIGTEAHHTGDLFRNRSLTYSITPTLTWTIFDGFSRRYSTIAAREQMEMAVESYNLTVMTAVEEVDNAMTSYVNSLRHIDLLDNVISQSRKSLELSVDLYKRGLAQFSNVVDAQMSLLENQNSLIMAQGQALTSLITLYEALGGGWETGRLQ